ncbi:MAG: Fic family protein [Gammaproteobacteria bacterium]
MKPPLKPPAYEALLSDYALRLSSIMQLHTEGVLAHGHYLHWDELRHRAPPEQLDHRSWWLAVKLTRRMQARSVPGLLDQAQRPFAYALTDRVLATLHRLDSEASGRIVLPDPVVNTATRDRYLFSSLVEEAITSSQLEGASTTRQVAREMLRTQRPPRDKSEQMIWNNYHAMETIRTMAKEPLTLAGLLELQRIVTDKTLPDASTAGRLQTPDEERVCVVDHKTARVLHIPPPAHELPERVAAMVEFANAPDSTERFIHPVVRAIVLHFWLAYDHPFVDGNGRTARALFYWSMLRRGYWLFEFLSISSILHRAPAQYAGAFLKTETDDNDLTYFLLYQLEVIERSLEALVTYLNDKAQQAWRVEKLLQGSVELNHRQIALLAHAIRHPGFIYSFKSHQTSHRIAYATARADLLDLANRGLLEQREVSAKAFIFQAPDDFEERLRACAR